MKKSVKLLSILIGYSAIALAVHCFLSYAIISNHLAAFDVPATSIISFEDLRQSFWANNFLLLILSILGLYLMLVFDVLKLNIPFEKSQKLVFIKGTDSSFKLKNACMFVIIYILFIFCLCSFSPFSMAIISFLLLIVFPASIIFWHKKKKILYVVYLIFSLLLMLMLKNNQTQHNKDFLHEVSFEYDYQCIESSDHFGLIFMGHKYYVMQDTISKTTFLYPTGQLENIQIK